MTNNELLFKACRDGRFKEVESLIVSVKLLIIRLKPKANLNAVATDGQTPLHVASGNGHKDIAELLIANGAIINAADFTGLTPLHLAAENGHLAVVKCLLTNGADKEARDRDGKTPVDIARGKGLAALEEFLETQAQKLARVNRQLIQAGKDGNLQDVQTALANGADVKARDKNNMTPLHLAAENGHLAVVKCLLTNGADKEARDRDGKTPLHFAAKLGHLDLVEYLVTHGANKEAVTYRETTEDDGGQLGYEKPCCPEKPSGGNWDQLTPLHFAALAGHVAVIEFLLANGVDIEAGVEKRKWTPLHLAAKLGHIDAVECLVQHGADKDAEGKSWSLTPLHLAAEKGHITVVKCLLAHGANINQRDWMGHTPLSWAAARGEIGSAYRLREDKGDYVDLVEFLLASGSEKDVIGRYGTPLSLAVQMDHLGAVECLLRYGASIYKSGSQSLDPLFLARTYHKENPESKSRAMILKLLEKKEEPYKLGKILSIFIYNGDIGRVKSLLAEGADPNVFYNGHTPLYIAVQNGKIEIVELLLTAGASVKSLTLNGDTVLGAAKAIGRSDIVKLLERAGAKD